MRRGAAVTCLVVACVVTAGCGSRETPLPSRPAAGGQAVSVGPLQVGVASPSDLKVLTLNSPGTSRVAFTVLYGTTITHLAEASRDEIAFATLRGRKGASEIWVMGADGSGQVQLTSKGIDDGPRWSPDGKRIAFVSFRDRNREIYVMRADGSGPVNLTQNEAVDDDPSWSPDGKRIAFTSDRKGHKEIHVMDADGSHPRCLTADRWSDFQPAWSPEGRRIAFVTSRDREADIYVMNADGSGQTYLTWQQGDNYSPAWSPDGTKIAFVSDRDRNEEIYVMDANGSEQTRLTQDLGYDHAPCWSPDGTRIVLQRARAGNPNIWVMNADGSGQTRLTSGYAGGREPSWRPTDARTFIGPPKSDGGTDPPFGAQRPLAVVGLTPRRAVSATSVGLDEASWPSIRVEALRHIGSALAGCKITADGIRTVDEDKGQGASARRWDVSGGTGAAGVLIFYSGRTGAITTIVAIAGGAATRRQGLVEAPGGRLLLRGEFGAAYSACAPEPRRVADRAHEIVVDGKAGELLSAR